MAIAPVALKDIEMLIPAIDINARIRTMAKDIAIAYKEDLMIVALLRGSLIFTADLIRALHKEKAMPQLDFMTLASYGKDKTSSGQVKLVRDLTESVEGREVLIVDDILESGRTLAYAHDLIKERGAKSIKVAVLLEKPGKRTIDVKADYVGFEVEDRFVVGYGLDFANYYRELPFIGVLPT